MRRFAIKDIGVLDRINKINRIMGRGSLILVSFLALAGAGCVYTDDSPDTNNVNEAEWGCLEELSENVFEPELAERLRSMRRSTLDRRGSARFCRKLWHRSRRGERV